MIIAHKKEYSNFIKATQKGYLYAVENKSKAITLLKKQLTDYDKANVDIRKSIDITAPYFGTDKECGFMKSERISAFLKWLVAHNLESEKIMEQHLFTNDLLK